MIVFEKPKALTDAPLHYCPGCTHGIIHRLVAEGYRELAKLEPERIKTIDASLPVEEIQEMIRGFVDGLK